MTVNPAEIALERTLFASRWLMAPFYLGLAAALVALLYKFGQQFLISVPALPDMGINDVILWILTLIDLSLVANLLLMVIFSGYENFVSQMHTDNNADRPAWMGTIDFSGMKLKLVASIVAISAIQLLKYFMTIEKADPEKLLWLVIVHLTFVGSGVLLAFMDFLQARAEPANVAGPGKT